MPTDPMRPVVVISQAFYPDSVSTSQLLSELLPRLGEEGIPIRVLCGFGFRADGTGPTVRRGQLGTVAIERCGLNVSTKGSSVTRALSTLSFLVHVGWRLLWIRRYHLVFGVTVPPFMAIVLGVVSLLRPLRYQYMLQDTYPEGLVALGRLSGRSPLTRLWRSLNRLGYRRAQRIVVLGRDMVPLLTEGYGIPPERISYVPHWSAVEMDRVVSFESSPLAAQLGISGKFVVQYSGNMGLWHDTDTIIRAAEKLQCDEHIHFLFIGDGMRRRSSEEMARRLGLRNVTWLDYMPKERLAETLTCCHAALISLREGLQGAAVPCKLYGILASGRAVIAQVPEGSEVSSTVQEENCGVVVPPGSAEGLAQAIRDLAADPEKAASMGARAFAAYRSKYTLDQAVETFRQLWGAR